MLDRLPEAQAEVLESSAAKDVSRVTRWQKSPDEALGKVVAQKSDMRDWRKDSGKTARARKRAAFAAVLAAKVPDKGSK